MVVSILRSLLAYSKNYRRRRRRPPPRAHMLSRGPPPNNRCSSTPALFYFVFVFISMLHNEFFFQEMELKRKKNSCKDRSWFYTNKRIKTSGGNHDVSEKEHVSLNTHVYIYIYQKGEKENASAAGRGAHLGRICAADSGGVTRDVTPFFPIFFFSLGGFLNVSMAPSSQRYNH